MGAIVTGFGFASTAADVAEGADLTRPAEQHMARRWESRSAVNHLGHFALASGLHRALAAARGARIVAVSSSTHLYSPVVFDDIHFAFRPHDPLLAYAQSKTANVLFAVGASIRWADDGITANSAASAVTRPVAPVVSLVFSPGPRDL